MNISKHTVSAFALVITAFTSAACTAEENEAAAPAVNLDATDESDFGTSHNGWTQQNSGEICEGSLQGRFTLHHTLTRSFGTATRGGGGCLITPIYLSGGEAVDCTASSDTMGDGHCTGYARSIWGSDAYGYCTSTNTCWARPGGQSAFCTLNSNRAPGTLSKTGWAPGYNAESSNGPWSIVGCMTKTAGPNTACGGTASSLYMRTQSGFALAYGCN